MTTIDSFRDVIGFLGTIGVTAATTTGVAYLLFKYLGDKWLTNKFNQQLESYKHAQQQELEQLRLRINAIFDRTVKLHDREFEVLPELWQRINDTYNNLSHFTSPLQEYADLDKLSAPEFEHFLSKSELADYQKDELREVKDKTKQYMRMRFWISFGKAAEKYNEFNDYFISKGIFIQDDVKALVGELRGLMSDALLEREHEERYPEPRKGRWEKSERFRKEGAEYRDAIEDAIHKRLWGATALPEPA